MVATADGWASNKQDAAGKPLRMPPTQPSPGSHPSRLLPKTHPACIAQVRLAGSTTIYDEMTDYFEVFGWKVLEWYGLRLKHTPTLEPCAVLALAVC